MVVTPPSSHAKPFPNRASEHRRIGQKQPLGQLRSENAVRRREAIVLVLFASGFHSGRHMCSFNRLKPLASEIRNP